MKYERRQLGLKFKRKISQITLDVQFGKETTQAIGDGPVQLLVDRLHCGVLPMELQTNQRTKMI